MTTCTHPDQTVFVAIELTAPTHEDAARAVRDLLAAFTIPGRRLADGVDCEAWFFPEQRDKHLDGNDRAHFQITDMGMAYLDNVAEDEVIDAMSVPCEGCGAEPGEPCRLGCLSDIEDEDDGQA